MVLLGVPWKKSPLTAPGIDPGTVRLVAQRLNHYATPGPTNTWIASRNTFILVKVKSHSCDKKQNFVNRVENLHLNNMPAVQWERNGYHTKDAHWYFRNNGTDNRMDFWLNMTDRKNTRAITIQKMIKQKLKHVFVVWMWLLRDQTYLNLNTYTGCPRRNVKYFGRVFLMLNYTDITQNTYIQSWTVTELMAIEKCGLLWCPQTVCCPWRNIRHAVTLTKGF